MRARTTTRIILRVFAAVAVAVCLLAWIWSYHRPLGIGRTDDFFLIAESKHGSVIVSRVDFEMLRRVLGTRAGWQLFSENCDMHDLATLADAWIGRHHLGFAFGVKPSATATDKIWVLDDNGLPVETTYAESGLPVPPPHKHHQFVLIVPWWFITFSVSAIGLLVWRKASPKYVGFPIAPSS